MYCHLFLWFTVYNIELCTKFLYRCWAKKPDNFFKVLQLVYMMTQKGNLYSLLKLYYAENNNFLLMTHDYDRPSFTVKSCGNC